MPFFSRSLLRWGAITVVCASFAACSSTHGSGGLLAALTPYRVSVVQGNVVTREQVEVLRPGMSKIQVREILGTPLLTSVFHEDRWDYLFTLQRQGVAPQSRKVAVFFKAGVLDRVDSDELPSEVEFAATLDAGARAPGKTTLEATPEQLQKFPPPPLEQAPELPPLPASYPPLEPGAR